MESESINRIVDAHIDLGETSDYVKFRVLHGIIENTLEFLTGLSSVSLDQKRFQDLPGLMRMIEEKLGRLPVDDQALKLNLKKYLENMKLPESITDRIASAMLEVIKKLKAQGNEEIKECIVDNWQLDRKIHGAFSFSPNCCHLMDQFKTVYLMSGLSGTATPIQDNKPFYNLSMETPVLADYAPAKEAPMKHKLSTIEALDAETTQKVYSPKYCPDDLTPSMVDTLFKRGFIGTYITSERTTGFNDPNLNHVAVLLDQDDDMNNPDQIIQAVGRNRGLNPAQQPYFMLVEDEGVSMAFSPDLLEKENYFGDLFKARENKHKKVTRSLGKKIAAEIQSWLETATDPYGAVDPIQLQEKTREILLREFNKIYEENHHNFKKAKAEFCGVLEDVHQALHMSAKALDRSYELPFAARVISNIVNTVSRVWYNHVTSSSKKAFNEECKKIAKTEDVKRERTYIHIIQKYNFKEIIVTSLAAKRLKDVIKETTEKTMSYIVNHLNPSLLEKEACEKINRFVKEGLAVKALKYLGTLEQQVKLFDLLQEKDWVELILQYANGLEIKNEADYISVFFEVIKKDKKINSYIEENKIELNLKSPEKAAASFTEKKDKLLQSLQNILTGESEKKEEDSTLLFNNFVKENLETIVFSLHPKHAAIFLKYKNNFNFNHTIFNEIDSQKVLDNAEIVSLLINGLEAGILTDQEKNDLAIDESDTFFKEGENIVKNIKHNLNSGEIRNSLSRSLERFIKSSEYSTLFSKILDPLSDDQLLIILDAIYPNDNDNARKRDLMIAFKKDVETLPAQALFDKYCTFTGTDLENTDLNKIQNWTSDVLGEITDSLCHYHGMSSRKGDAFGAIIQPKLKKVPNQNHPIWRLHATDDSSFLTGLAKKTQFIKGIIDAFDSWNSIDKIKNKHLKKAMQGAAASVIHHVTAAAQNKKLEASSDFGLSKMFGEQIFRGSSLTAQEIASPETKITGGVEKITSNSQEGVLEKGSVAPHMPENIQKQEPLMTHSVVHKTTVIGKVASVCAILTVAMAVASLVCHATIFAIPVGVICSIASAGFLIVGVVAKAIEKKQNSEKSICSNATTFRNGLYTNLISQQDNSLVV